MDLLFFSFRRSYGNSRIAQQHLLLVSATLRIFMNRVTLLSFDFRRVSRLTYYATKGAKYLETVNQRLHVVK
ncbi:hypothetical protein GmHk_03G006537 [Glycine max]|nr:hypothetical protein GmHk_03G006537 [Glycine max]